MWVGVVDYLGVVASNHQRVGALLVQLPDHHPGVRLLLERWDDDDVRLMPCTEAHTMGRPHTSPAGEWGARPHSRALPVRAEAATV